MLAMTITTAIKRGLYSLYDYITFKIEYRKLEKSEKLRDRFFDIILAAGYSIYVPNIRPHLKALREEQITEELIEAILYLKSHGYILLKDGDPIVSASPLVELNPADNRIYMAIDRTSTKQQSDFLV